MVLLKKIGFEKIWSWNHEKLSYQSAEIKAVFKRFELMPRHGKISLGTIEHKVQEYLAVVAQGADKGFLKIKFSSPRQI